MFYNRSHYAHKYASATLIHITFWSDISFVSLRGLDYLIFRESTPLPRPPILSQTAKFHTPFCGTKHFHRAHLHYSTTFHDLLGAFLPCLVRPLFTASFDFLFLLGALPCRKKDETHVKGCPTPTKSYVIDVRARE